MVGSIPSVKIGFNDPKEIIKFLDSMGVDLLLLQHKGRFYVTVKGWNWSSI